MRVSLTVPGSPTRTAPQPADDMVWSYPKYELFRNRLAGFTLDFALMIECGS